MPKLSFQEALLLLGIGGVVDGARINREFARGICGYCGQCLPPLQECRDYKAEQSLTEMGWSHTYITNQDKKVGIFKRPAKFKAKVEIYSCPSCGKRVGMGLTRN